MAYYFWVERLYPLLFSITLGIVTLQKNIEPSNVNNIGELIAVAINIGAILLGFLSVMISIMITLNESSVMKRIRDNKSTYLLNEYLLWSLVSGFVITVYSMGFTVLYDIDCKWLNYVFAVWVFILTFFLASSFRIILILLRILKLVFETGEKSPQLKYVKPDGSKAFKSEKQTILEEE